MLRNFFSTSKDVWNHPYDTLRKKWHEVPIGDNRMSTKEMLELNGKELTELWFNIRDKATSGSSFPVRGWYHVLYKDIFHRKKVMDVGSGFGIDGITFAMNGAEITFVDIVESNLEILKRICNHLKIKNVKFCYMEDITSLKSLPNNYDVIWCQGSLINMPFDITYKEVQELLSHLPVNGRWIELAYPKERWEKEGKLSFDRWGEKTDGIGTPWVEWYDLEKLKKLLSPAEFDVVLHFNFYNSDYNWFDLIRRK